MCPLCGVLPVRLPAEKSSSVISRERSVCAETDKAETTSMVVSIALRGPATLPAGPKTNRPTLH